MLNSIRSFLARREEKWILAAFQEAAKDPDGVLFFTYHPLSRTVRAGMSQHGRPDSVSRDFGAIRIRGWGAFRRLFRTCAEPYEKTALLGDGSLLLSWSFRGHPRDARCIGVCFHPPDWLERMRRAWPVGSTDHDCGAGVCTSGDFC
jgi:hypothetical protein